MYMQCNIPEAICNKEKSIIKENACMKFYDETQPHVPRDRHIWSSDLELSLLQTRSDCKLPKRQGTLTTAYSDPITFASKSPVKCRKKVQQH